MWQMNGVLGAVKGFCRGLVDIRNVGVLCFPVGFGDGGWVLLENKYGLFLATVFW